MKFSELPVGIKFIVENTTIIDYFTKLSEYHYNCNNYVHPIKWNDTNTDECYPLIEWENEMFLTKEFLND